MRFGLMTNKKRSWSKVGERTRLPNQMEYKNRYLYSAIAPLTGESVHISLVSVMQILKLLAYFLMKLINNSRIPTT